MREIDFDQDKIMSICREAVSSGETAGCSILIGRDGREVLYFGAGDADREAKKPIRRDTIFRLYSMSKPLTGVAVMLLMQDGKLDLNDPVERYIPTFANPKVCENGKIRDAKYSVRIFNLLNMTSGLSYDGHSNETEGRTSSLIEKIKADMSTGSAMTTQEIAMELGRIPLSFDPGERFQYGMSADVLGAVVEKVSGESFGDFLKERLLDPLGMKDTGFWVPETKRERLAATYEYQDGKLIRFEMPHLGISVTMDRKPAFESGGAGLVSTVDDWAKFCEMLVNGGTFGDQQILCPGIHNYFTTETITEKQSVGLESWDSLYGYSYGNLMRKMIHPELASSLSSYGEYGWDGWLGTYMSVVPEYNMYIIYMEQRTGAGTTRWVREIRNCIFENTHPSMLNIY